MLFALELSLAVLSLGVALWLRPWRMLRGPLLTPTLAAVALLPWLWLLPQKMPQGLQVQLSGACLLVLMLGWPLAVLVLALVALAVGLIGQSGLVAALSQWVWIGLVPATLALGIGAVLRRWLPPNPFVYTLGRGFLGTAAAVFLAGVVREVSYRLAGGVALEQALVARWLMAWGDAFLTGMFTAIFVAFVPGWLATWSDERYLKPPQN
ncbi:MAG: hypothetical protein A2W72_03660 [Burkholderiales bacterium RIFCSPLOWO2_12_67_14]|nr:MAG: hypothetical protein A3I64_11875 [Burkholderiales bacterium RIFCSPLOWO2_02_FULL_67_64]OGB45827.1 MAG: hypothetical protein A3E51_26095 [Burkholderiales bacterium RIFCSPHIGHO2_12_FULL_67_38]OGB46325.1 MAG: hypothetical protein A2W72_03660 [Burkholderiales bacterium RIFCSPLOWO2_12_67_14]OGB77194.1 MAG: hypothetical protein A3G82_19885 [Burkholderiales bacterium RIFCSPLOWO2_12_FULL_67_210]